MMFVTALRTICLAVGVIAGKMERVTQMLVQVWRLGSVWEPWAAALVYLMTVALPAHCWCFFWMACLMIYQKGRE